MSGFRPALDPVPVSIRQPPPPVFPGAAVRRPPRERRRRRELPDPPARPIRCPPASRWPLGGPAGLCGGRRGPEGAGGWILVEVMIALTVLTVGVLGFMISFQANFRATREMGYRDLAQASLETAAEELGAEDFATVYAAYQGSTFAAPGLVGPDGNPALVRVNFEVNETTLAAGYGPVADIDGDGAKNTTNASASYVLLPTRLSLSYQMSYGIETKVMYLVLAAK